MYDMTLWLNSHLIYLRDLSADRWFKEYLESFFFGPYMYADIHINSWDLTMDKMSPHFYEAIICSKKP